MIKLYICLLVLMQISPLLGAPEVQLPNGLIRGREGVTKRDKHYYAFGKIPYAKPPVGRLRFKAPVPPENWENPLDTLDLDVSCYQRGNYELYQSEDCLYLSVYTPELPKDDNNISLAVIVYIHGGGFITGTGMNVTSDWIIEEDVIFVAINYRLGPLGFLSTQDEIIPGNMGLKDQQLALEWIHNNIHLFGGDPDKITIFGSSAGSASCSYHLLNQKSKDLFRGVILESGTFLSPWSFQRNAREMAFGFAATLNNAFLTNNRSEDLLEFLQSIEAMTLNVAQAQHYRNISGVQNMEILQGYTWAPVVEVKNPNAFLTKNMYSLLKAGNVVPLPMLLGICSEEGIAFNQNPDDIKLSTQQWDEHLDWLVPDDMRVSDDKNRIELGTKIREIYTEGEPLADHLGDGVRYFSDTSFSRPVIKTAEIYSQFAKTYFYQYSYDGELSHLGVFYDNAGHVGHSQELNYIFCRDTGCDLSSYPESDQVTSRRLIKIRTNFAKYQNPTPETDQLFQNITWPLVNLEDGDFLYVDIDEDLEIRNHPKEEIFSKWVELYDSLGYDDFDTY